jgi:hypothetical protein
MASRNNEPSHPSLQCNLARVSHQVRVDLAFVGGEKKLQIPPLPPDFLSSSVEPANLMRLSSKKPARVALSRAA